MADGGAKGLIECGEGSCASPVDYSSRYYTKYNGMAFFFSSSLMDSLSVMTFQEVKEMSDSTQVSNGKFSIGLDPGTYTIYLKEQYYTPVYDNTIIVYYEKVTEQEYKFWNCTSY